MKVRFLGATPEEDQIVDIPENTTEVQVEMPEREANTWPAVAVLILGMLWILALVWVFRG